MQHGSSIARVAYKEFIDALVKETLGDMRDKTVREEGVYCNAFGYEKMNALVQSLSNESRAVLAEILLDQRQAILSKALCLLEYKLGEALAITFFGEPIPWHLCEGEPHGDYLARCSGWKWLDDSPA